MHIRVIRVLFACFLLLLMYCCKAQSIQMLASGTKTSIRGLSVVNDNVLWISGSNGTVARSVDGGKTFNWITVKGYEQRDFRDVEAFDANTAIVLAIAEPAVILKTTDAGKTWKKVFEDSTKGMFLDAIDFNGKYGAVVGDPINNRMFMATTDDFGNTWKVSNNTSNLIKDEAFFASSGTNIKALNTRHKQPLFYYVTGGMQSRFFSFADTTVLPLVSGKNTTGANSLACNGENYCVVVGGDFTNDKDTLGNCVIVSFQNKDQNGFAFIHPQTPPHGYRSCVEFINEKQLITCGTSGVDISNDGGMNWILISPESFHVCQKAKEGNAVYLAGKEGRIARLNF